jgi:hypothetical protein
MTNQRRNRFSQLLTTDDSSACRDRVMTAFWVSTSTTTNAQVVDLASRRSRAL